MNYYVCPFCKTRILDGVESLVAHREPGGVCETLMNERLAEDEDGPCCYGFVTSRGRDHEIGCVNA